MHTWIQPEEYAYPNGGQTRKGRALFPDGKLRRVWVGVPDTFFSAPAHGWVCGKYVAGFVSYSNSVTKELLLFTPNRRG